MINFGLPALVGLEKRMGAWRGTSRNMCRSLGEFLEFKHNVLVAVHGIADGWIFNGDSIPVELVQRIVLYESLQSGSLSSPKKSPKKYGLRARPQKFSIMPVKTRLPLQEVG